MGDKKGDRSTEKVYFVLKNSSGLSITEIVDKTKLNRSDVRTTLAKLDGGKKVSVRRIGMAKVYSLTGRIK